MKGSGNMARKIPVLPALAGVAAAVVYKAARGHGVFNTLRFHKEHDAVKRYVAAHYPGARYGLLGQTDCGLGTVVDTDSGKIWLSVTRLPGGRCVFAEKPIG